MLVATFVLLAGVAGAQPPDVPPMASIVGRVVDADTGQPLKDAEVKFYAAGSSPTPGVTSGRTDTAADGTYQFRIDVPGSYVITASHAQYIAGTYGSTTLDARDGSIQVRAGETLKGVDIALVRGAVIAGRVVDTRGNPVVAATVVASRKGSLGGVLKFIPVGSPSTSRSPDGRFEVDALPAGSYYIEVHPPLSVKHPEERTRYLVTLFPGTASLDAARTITVSRSEIVSGLTLPLAAASVARVSGVAVDSLGQPVTSGSVVAIPRHAELAGYPPTYGAPLKPDGAFAIDGLVAGEYLLRAPSGARGGEYAELALTVGFDDIDGIRIAAAPLNTISGRLTRGPAGAILSAASMDGDGGAVWGPPHIARPDRSFEIKVRPGRQLLRAQASGWTMTRITLGGLDVTETGIDVRAGEPISGVEVEMTSGFTAVGGFVATAEGLPVVGATVVIFDRHSEHWRTPFSNVHTVTTDARGAFSVAALRAGEYHAIAVRSSGTVDVSDPQLLEMLARRASGFAITAGELKELRLTLAFVD